MTPSISTASKRGSPQQSGTHKRVRVQTASLIRNSNKRARLALRLRTVFTSSIRDQDSNTPTYSSHNPADDDDADVHDEVVMAVEMRNNDTIGCAYFVAAEETLYVSNDVKCGGRAIIERFKQYIEPTIVIVSSRADELVEDYFRNESARDEDDSDQFYQSYVLEIRPANEFNYDNAVRKLVDLDLEIFRASQATLLVPDDEDSSRNSGRGLEPGLSYIPGNVVQLSSAIDLGSRLSVSCVAAVIAYVEKRAAVAPFPQDEAMAKLCNITYLETFGLDEVMSLNLDALISMQILQNDYHPHAHNRGPNNTASNSKQSLSVFGLFQNLARTPQGKYLLRQYFLRPSLNRRVLDSRHQAISVLLQPNNELILQDLVKSLRNVTNTKATIQGLKKGVSNGVSRGGGMKSSVWFKLRSFAYYTLMIEQDVSKLKHAGKLEIRNKIVESFDRRALGTIGRAIIEVIDFGESHAAHRSVVLRGVDANLDQMKRQYDGLEDMLNHVSREISQTIPADFATSLSVVFLPQIGFLIAMSMNPVTETVDYQDPTWEQSFHTAETMYFKDFRMTELDNTVGDIYADICEIVHDLAQRVLQYAETLARVSDICAELDCLTALAQGAKMYNLVRPTITDDNIIDVDGGWFVDGLLFRLD